MPPSSLVVLAIRVAISPDWQIRAGRQSADAMVALEAGADRLERGGVAKPVHDDVASVGREPAGGGQSEAARRPGDERALA